MKHSINIIITAVLLSLTSTAMANTKPYCTVASSEGSQWWTWTVKPQKKACKIATQKLTSKGHKVNWKWRSHYSDNSLNSGKLICKRKNGAAKSNEVKIIGNGSNIFPNALNMAKQKGWSVCYFKM